MADTLHWTAAIATVAAFPKIYHLQQLLFLKQLLILLNCNLTLKSYVTRNRTRNRQKNSKMTIVSKKLILLTVYHIIEKKNRNKFVWNNNLVGNFLTETKINWYENGANVLCIESGLSLESRQIRDGLNWSEVFFGGHIHISFPHKLNFCSQVMWEYYNCWMVAKILKNWNIVVKAYSKRPNIEFKYLWDRLVHKSSIFNFI